MSKNTFTEELLAIKTDRTSGAAEIARKCLEIIAANALQVHVDSTRDLLSTLSSQADLLAQSRPSMAPVANLLHTFQKHIKSFSHASLEETRVNCANAAKGIIAASLRATAETANHVAACIGKNRTILTHSYSSTILQALTLLSTSNLQVIISESRPLCEGYNLAEKLSELQIPTILITDAQTGLFVNKADFVIVGADTILPDFTVLNKAGTYLTALAAHDRNIPFYVCSEKLKQIPAGAITPELEKMDGVELNAPELPHVTVENIYFDLTPARLITGWINENGLLPLNS